ncbi:MAG: DNA polymerase III subunit beta [Chitinophagaceae bacterium]
MQFVVSSGALSKKLHMISGVTSTNNVLPILEFFLFQINKNLLTITSTDLETTMQVSLDIQSGDEGEVCIQSKVLLDYLKNLPEQPITIDINKKDFGIDMTSNQGKYKIVGQDASNFPSIPENETQNNFSMPASELSDAIAKTIIAVSNDDIRPAMSGVYFEINNKNIVFVSTDAHRLVRCIKTDVSGQNNSHFIVPKKALTQLKNNLDSSTEVTLSYNDNHLFIDSDQLHLSCRLIDAKFPDYKVVIPTDNPYKLTLPKDEFLSALRRVNVFANKATNQVVLDIQGNNLHLYSQDVDYSFEGNEELACQYEGEDLKIAFNARLLIELIVAIDADEIRLELSTPNRAGILKPNDERTNEDLLMLIMPLMIAG